MSSAGSELCCEILLLLDMDQRSEHLVHLVHMNKLSACRDVCGMHSWKMAQDVGMVWKCCGVIPI